MSLLPVQILLSDQLRDDAGAAGERIGGDESTATTAGNSSTLTPNPPLSKGLLNLINYETIVIHL